MSSNQLLKVGGVVVAAVVIYQFLPPQYKFGGPTVSTSTHQDRGITTSTTTSHPSSNSGDQSQLGIRGQQNKGTGGGH